MLLIHIFIGLSVERLYKEIEYNLLALRHFRYLLLWQMMLHQMEL